MDLGLSLLDKVDRMDTDNVCKIALLQQCIIVGIFATGR